MSRFKKVPKNMAGPILLVYALLYAVGLFVSIALLLGYQIF
jgi:hypothetical protein